MKEITLIVFTTFVASALSLDDNVQAISKHFHDFLDEIHGKNYKMGLFVKLMWPKIQQILPETVEVPGVEVFGHKTDSYMCGTSTSVQTKIGKITHMKEIPNKNKDEEKIVFDVVAELFLDGKPVEFKIFKKIGYNDSSPAVPVSVTFKDPGSVRIVLEIYNFLGKQKVSPKCVVRVRNIMVVDVGFPASSTDSTDPSADEIAERYLNSMDADLLKTLGSVSLVKAVGDRLKDDTRFWVCSSKDFDDVQKEYQMEWEYTDNYKQYCLKKNLTN